MKELRIKNGITQEKLAEQLSVTPQAVSRWESGAGYPDFETIPQLAVILNTSTDTLFGLDKKGEELRKYKEDLLERISLLNWRKMIGEIRTAYETYPGDEDLLYWLGSCLCTAAVNHKDEISEDECIQFYREADILLNRILETSTDDKRRRDVKTILVQELYRVYDIDKAIEMANQLNPIGLTMQNQTMPLLTGEARVEYAKTWFPVLLAQIITFALFARDSEGDIQDKNYDTDLKEQRIRKEIYESFYEYIGDEFTERKNTDSFYRNTFLGLFRKSENDDEALSALECYVDLCGLVENEINAFGDRSTAILFLKIAMMHNDDVRLKITNGEFKTYGELYYYQLVNNEHNTIKSTRYFGNPRFEAAMERLKKMGPNI